jgi:tRNA (guanine26-N2/guanine27-N2)-dimethyltransferase
MTGLMMRQAAIYEYAATPLFSYYADHYIRAYYSIRKGARRADRQLEKMGYIKYCPVCLHRETSENNMETLCECGEPMKVGGPLWLGELSDLTYTCAMIEDLYDLPYLVDSKAHDIIRLVQGEYGYPVGFFIIDSFCKLVGVQSVATDEALSAIELAGYKVTRVHYDPRGFKTNASASELLEVFKQFKK